MIDSEFGIRCTDKKHKEMLEEPVTRENCGSKIVLIMEVTGMSRRALAKTIGVSESTLRRIEIGSSSQEGTRPTEDFMNRLRGLCAIGIAKYREMSDAQKEKISEVVAATGGVVAGVGGSIAAIGAAGAVSGFSAAGITSGLAAIGGGAMLTGIAVVGVIPVATGLLGYGLVKGIKAICEANNLSCTEVNERWEISTKEKKEN
jgi:transcriptional regulator with XRE-family HTH domain